MSAQYFQGSRSYCNDEIYISEEWLVSYVIRVASEETGRHLSFGVLTVKNHYARTVQKITEP
jgi:hypothetical protein